MSVESVRAQLIDLPDLVWPITYKWDVLAPWGNTQQELTVNVPTLANDEASSRRLGSLLWSMVCTPVLHRDVQLVTTWCMCWRGSSVATFELPLNMRGSRSGTVAPRNDSAVLLLHTSHLDRRSRRRLFLPGIPRAWSADGVLSDGALGDLESHTQGVFMGMASHLTGSPIGWYIGYTGALESTPANLYGIGFRRVEYVRVCQYTDKAPDMASGVWP